MMSTAGSAPLKTCAIAAVFFALVGIGAAESFDTLQSVAPPPGYTGLSFAEAEVLVAAEFAKENKRASFTFCSDRNACTGGLSLCTRHEANMRSGRRCRGFPNYNGGPPLNLVGTFEWEQDDAVAFAFNEWTVAPSGGSTTAAPVCVRWETIPDPYAPARTTVDEKCNCTAVATSSQGVLYCESWACSRLIVLACTGTAFPCGWNITVGNVWTYSHCCAYNQGSDAGGGGGGGGERRRSLDFDMTYRDMGAIESQCVCTEPATTAADGRMGCRRWECVASLTKDVLYGTSPWWLETTKGWCAGAPGQPCEVWEGFGDSASRFGASQCVLTGVGVRACFERYLTYFRIANSLFGALVFLATLLFLAYTVLFAVKVYNGEVFWVGMLLLSLPVFVLANVGFTGVFGGTGMILTWGLVAGVWILGCSCVCVSTALRDKHSSGYSAL